VRRCRSPPAGTLAVRFHPRRVPESCTRATRFCAISSRAARALTKIAPDSRPGRSSRLARSPLPPTPSSGQPRPRGLAPHPDRLRRRDRHLRARCPRRRARRPASPSTGATEALLAYPFATKAHPHHPAQHPHGEPSYPVVLGATPLGATRQQPPVPCTRTRMPRTHPPGFADPYRMEWAVLPGDSVPPTGTACK